MSLKIDKNRQEITNIVRISRKKDDSVYIKAILIRMQPKIYNKYNCIKIRVSRNLLGDAQHLCQIFKHAGLMDKGIEPCKIETDDGFVINDAFEVTLKKVPAIIYPEE